MRGQLHVRKTETKLFFYTFSLIRGENTCVSRECFVFYYFLGLRGARSDILPLDYFLSKLGKYSRGSADFIN